MGLSLLSGSTLGVEDVLNTPSVESKLASESLLLDVDLSGNRVVAVGARGHALYSDNEGKTWKQAKVPVSVLLTAVDFVVENRGWAVGHSGVILKTVDGGINWDKQFDGDQANKMIITQSEHRLAEMQLELETVPEEESEDLQYEVEEAAFAVEDARSDAQVGASKPLLDVLFSSTKEGFTVGAYGYFFKTADGGETWGNYGDRIDNPDRFHLNAINSIQGGAIFIVGEGGIIFRSTDNGESWEALDSPYTGSFFGVTGTNDANVVLVFGLRGNIYRSEDAGDSWVKIEVATESSMLSAAVNKFEKITLVGTAGSVLLSNDGGRTFTETIRGNRLGNASAIYVQSSHVVMVGEAGINITDPSGTNL